MKKPLKLIKVKIGDRVRFNYKQRLYMPSICFGIVRDIFITTFGGKVRKKGVRLSNLSINYPYCCRNTTVIAIDKIRSIII